MESVTGHLPPAEREARIDALADGGGLFVLVCTDCLSEGINLQEHFDAVLHYDLAWNPTRHEQREGRVDRFGQRRRQVRVVTYYGTDNAIDGVILDVLIRKHKSIKSDLGVAVAVPASAEQMAETLFEGALFREQAGAAAQQLPLDFIDDLDLDAKKQDLHAEWENARNREKASRSRFAQHTLHPEVVAAELERVRAAIGGSQDVARFFTAVLHSANVPARMNGRIEIRVSHETPRTLRQAIGREERFAGRFDLPLAEGEIHLGRTSPVVEGLASWTLDQALDPESLDAGGSVAARCGAIVTKEVSVRCWWCASGITCVVAVRVREPCSVKRSFHWRVAVLWKGRSGCRRRTASVCWRRGPRATCCRPPSNSSSVCCCPPCRRSRRASKPSQPSVRMPNERRTNACAPRPASRGHVPGVA